MGEVDKPAPAPEAPKGRVPHGHERTGCWQELVGGELVSVHAPGCQPAPAPEPKQGSEEPIDWEKAELWAAGTAQGDARLSQVQAARAFLALRAQVETFRKDAKYWKNQVKDLEGDRAELAIAREQNRAKDEEIARLKGVVEACASDFNDFLSGIPHKEDCYEGSGRCKCGKDEAYANIQCARAALAEQPKEPGK